MLFCAAPVEQNSDGVSETISFRIPASPGTTWMACIYCNYSYTGKTILFFWQGWHYGKYPADCTPLLSNMKTLKKKVSLPKTARPIICSLLAVLQRACIAFKWEIWNLNEKIHSIGKAKCGLNTTGQVLLNCPELHSTLIHKMQTSDATHWEQRIYKTWSCTHQPEGAGWARDIQKD